MIVAHRHRSVLLLLSLVATFVAVRVCLHFAPDTDLNVGRFNIHHLFAGLLLIVAGGVPLVIGIESRRRRDLAIVVFAIGLSLALDEWVYLIATDGSNASYWQPISFLGGALMIGLASAYVVVVYLLKR